MRASTPATWLFSRLMKSDQAAAVGGFTFNRRKRREREKRTRKVRRVVAFD